MEELKTNELCPFCNCGRGTHRSDCYIHLLKQRISARSLSKQDAYDSDEDVSEQELDKAWNTRASISHADLQALIDELELEIKRAPIVDIAVTFEYSVNKLKALLGEKP